MKHSNEKWKTCITEEIRVDEPFSVLGESSTSLPITTQTSGDLPPRNTFRYSEEGPQVVFQRDQTYHQPQHQHQHYQPQPPPPPQHQHFPHYQNQDMERKNMIKNCSLLHTQSSISSSNCLSTDYDSEATQGTENLQSAANTAHNTQDNPNRRCMDAVPRAMVCSTGTTRERKIKRLRATNRRLLENTRHHLGIIEQQWSGGCSEKNAPCTAKRATSRDIGTPSSNDDIRNIHPQGMQMKQGSLIDDALELELDQALDKIRVMEEEMGRINQVNDMLLDNNGALQNERDSLKEEVKLQTDKMNELFDTKDELERENELLGQERDLVIEALRQVSPQALANTKLKMPRRDDDYEDLRMLSYNPISAVMTTHTSSVESENSELDDSISQQLQMFHADLEELKATVESYQAEEVQDGAAHTPSKKSLSQNDQYLNKPKSSDVLKTKDEKSFCESTQRSVDETMASSDDICSIDTPDDVYIHDDEIEVLFLVDSEYRENTLAKKDEKVQPQLMSTLRQALYDVRQAVSILVHERDVLCKERNEIQEEVEEQWKKSAFIHIQLQEAKTRGKCLTKELKKLKGCSDQATRDIENAENRVMALETLVSKREKERDASRVRVEELDEERQALELSNQNLIQANETVEKRATLLETECIASRCRIEELGQDRDILRMTNGNLVEANDSIQTKLETSWNRVKEVVEERDILERTNQTLTDENKQLHQEKKELVEERDNLEQINQTLTDENKQLHQEKAELVAVREQQIIQTLTIRHQEPEKAIMNSVCNGELITQKADDTNLQVVTFVKPTKGGDDALQERSRNNEIVPFGQGDATIFFGYPQGGLFNIELSLGPLKISIPFVTFLATFVQILFWQEKMTTAATTTTTTTRPKRAGRDIFVDNGHIDLSSIDNFALYFPITACISLLAQFVW